MKRRQITQPEMLLDTPSEELRHPMWVAPKPDEPLGVHIRSLRAEIARKLTAFDGKPGPWDRTIRYFEQVYKATTHEQSSNFIWLLGQITWLRLVEVRDINQMLSQATRPRPGRRSQDDARWEQELRVQRDNIEALCDSFVQATVKEIN